MNYYKAGSMNDIGKLGKRINFTGTNEYLKAILRGKDEWSDHGPFNGATLS